MKGKYKTLPEIDPRLILLSRVLGDFRDAGASPMAVAEVIKACFDEWLNERIAKIQP